MRSPGLTSFDPPSATLGLNGWRTGPEARAAVVPHTDRPPGAPQVTAKCPRSAGAGCASRTGRREVNLRFLGVSATDVAAIIAC